MAAVPTLRACTQDTDPGVGLCEFTVWHHTHTHTPQLRMRKKNRIAGKEKKKKEGKTKEKRKMPNRN